MIFAVSESAIARHDASEMNALYLRSGSHALDDCGVCACDGHHELSLLIVLCARGEVYHGYFGRHLVQMGYGMICVEGCPDGSSGGLHRAVLSLNDGHLEAHLVAGVRGYGLKVRSRSAAAVHGAHRRAQPFLS